MSQHEMQDTPAERNPKKVEESERIRRETEEFLARGKEIKEIPWGTFSEIKYSYNNKRPDRKAFTESEFKLRKGML